MEEPSVLDYIKDKLAFWRKPSISIPPEKKPEVELVVPGSAIVAEGEQPVPKKIEQPAVLEPPFKVAELPFFTFAALIFALLAQRTVEPPGRDAITAAIFYALAAVGLVVATWRKEIQPATLPASISLHDQYHYRWMPLLVGWLLAIAAFWDFGKGVFTPRNTILWVFAIVALVWAFWIGKPDLHGRYTWLQTYLRSKEWNLQISFWTLLLLFVTSAILFSRLHSTWVLVILALTWLFWISRSGGRQRLTQVLSFLRSERESLRVARWVVFLLLLAGMILFFRIYRLSQVPPEMVSDHAEKLLDVSDVLNGQTNIFFPRNTGREGFQMYLTAAIALVFGTGLTFMSLKIGTVLAGLVTLPYIYLLGKEFGNRNVGLIALAFAGIAYWPNVISRIALRFTLYPLFTAPALYYLLRGLRRSNRNDFILSGLFLGLGLHGYSPFRIVPLLIVIAVVLFLLHQPAKGIRRQTIIFLILVALIALVVFIPLLRYALEHPDMFSYRTLTRLGTLEKPLDAPAWQIFLKNLWNALVMFGWDDGEVWVVSVTHRPALSIVAAVLFHLGVVLALIRYWRERSWQDLLLLLSVPILMLPSILSLAFPSENPILNRTAGAIIPAFILVGIALEAILAAIKKSMRASWGVPLAWVIGILLFSWSAVQDYDLVFHKYQEDYARSAWNTSEMGNVIHDFVVKNGDPNSAWVVAFPYWVDTRLVGINAGYPTKDYAISPDNFQDTLSDPNAKLFLIKPEDTGSIDKLQQLYPQGTLKEYSSQVEGKNFWMFFVTSYDSSP